MATEVIKVEGLTKVFGSSVVAVDNVSFAVYEGEVFGFLGPNGAGETTTINMLTTIAKPSAGKAWVCGHDIQGSRSGAPLHRRSASRIYSYPIDASQLGVDFAFLAGFAFVFTTTGIILSWRHLTK